MKTKYFFIVLFTIIFFNCTCFGKDIAKYACEQDADCMNSCSQGAVNATWYSKEFAIKTECLDGCDGPATSSVRCVNKICATFQFGKYAAHCSRGQNIQPPYPLELTKFSCDRNTDCLMHCAHGAVNRSWNNTNGNKDACEDGCVGEGTYPRCEKHICTAYRDDKPYAECTKVME